MFIKLINKVNAYDHSNMQTWDFLLINEIHLIVYSLLTKIHKIDQSKFTKEQLLIIYNIETEYRKIEYYFKTLYKPNNRLSDKIREIITNSYKRNNLTHRHTKWLIYLGISVNTYFKFHPLNIDILDYCEIDICSSIKTFQLYNKILCEHKQTLNSILLNYQKATNEIYYIRKAKKFTKVY